jgi:fatty acid desaturase
VQALTLRLRLWAACLASLKVKVGAEQLKNLSGTSVKQLPGGLNAGITAVQLFGIAAFIYALKHFEGWPALLLLALGFGIWMNSVYSIIHEAEHGVLFKNRFWNDCTGAFMALFFPAPFHLIRQGHLGHHLRNRSDDEAFDLYFEENHRVWRSLVLYGILTGFYWVAVVLGNVVFLFLPFSTKTKYWQFDRPSAAFFESLNPNYRRIIQIECAAAIGLHVGIVWLLDIVWWHYAAMYAGFGFMWSAMQYVHHYGTERHVTKGARNLFVFAPLDWLWLHHNWHRAHHENPTVPWIHLPRIAADESGARGFLPWAYLKMWRGPRQTTERVENRYAGKLIP